MKRAISAVVLFLMEAKLGLGFFTSVPAFAVSTTTLRLNHKKKAGRLPRIPRSNVLGLQVSTHTCDENEPRSDDIRKRLWQLLSQAPSSSGTSSRLTQEILYQVQKLEQSCPTEDSQVIEKLSGAWELLWTALDTNQTLQQRDTFCDNDKIDTWFMEGQDPTLTNTKDGTAGISNPVLPSRIQKGLERIGILDQPKALDNTSNDNNNISLRDAAEGRRNDPRKVQQRSTQSIDLQKQRATNVVSFRLFRRISVTIAIQIDIAPNSLDPRRIDVEFQNCRVTIPFLRLDFNLPLGFLGLRKGLLRRGWLRTTYIDDNFRITRGHRGSVFVLARPKARRQR